MDDLRRKSFENIVFDGGLWKKHRFSEGRVGNLAIDWDGNVWIPIYKNEYQAEGVTFIPSDPYKYRSPLENTVSHVIDSNGLIYLNIFLLGVWSYFATRVWRSGGLNLADLPGYFVSKKEQVKKTLLSIGCLILGMLAVFPYVTVASFYLPQWHWISDVLFGSLGSVVFFSGFFLGIPFGIAGIILGVLSWRRSLPGKMGLLFAAIGILLGVAGILGHVWFFATCQFCQ